LGVYFQYLDQAVNHLLGLSEKEESVYAVIPLSVEPTIWSANGSDRERMVSSVELIRELQAIHPVHYVRSKKVKEFPMLTKLNQAAMQNSSSSFDLVKEKQNIKAEGQLVALPETERMIWQLQVEIDFLLAWILCWGKSLNRFYLISCRRPRTPFHIEMIWKPCIITMSHASL
jgi:hypothetical protein